MKSLTDFMSQMIHEEDESIKSEKDFREAVKAKFEAVFGDDLDEERMNFTIKGFLDDNKELVERGKWAELIGMFNQSFAG